VDDASAQFDEVLEGGREVGDAEVRKREAIARTAATLMRVSVVGLEALAFALLSLVERDVEQRRARARSSAGNSIRSSGIRGRRYGFVAVSEARLDPRDLL